MDQPSQIGNPSRLNGLDEAIERIQSLLARPGRTVLGIVGAPGSGKSTVCAQLLAATGQDAVLVGMDGFHFANEVLISQGSRDRKGAPETFDVAGYTAMLDRIRARQQTVYAPAFDRDLEAAIAGAVSVPARPDLVITEGNYLLHDAYGWEAVRSRLDEVWFIDVPTQTRIQRLINRRLSHGHPLAAAVDWVHQVDEANAALVERGRAQADFILAVSQGTKSPAGGSANA